MYIRNQIILFYPMAQSNQSPYSTWIIHCHIADQACQAWKYRCDIPVIDKWYIYIYICLKGKVLLKTQQNWYLYCPFTMRIMHSQFNSIYPLLFFYFSDFHVQALDIFWLSWTYSYPSYASISTSLRHWRIQKSKALLAIRQKIVCPCLHYIVILPSARIDHGCKRWIKTILWFCNSGGICIVCELHIYDSQWQAISYESSMVRCCFESLIFVLKHTRPSLVGHRLVFEPGHDHKWT